MSSPLTRLVPALVVVSLLAGCAQAPSKETIGAGIGAVGGGLIGGLFGHGLGKVATTAIGGLLGAWGGAAVGKTLDGPDKDKADEAFETAQQAPVGETVSWRSPETGNSGSVAVTGEGTDSSGRSCRDYTTVITVAGRDEVVRGTACRQPDGTWAALR